MSYLDVENITAAVTDETGDIIALFRKQKYAREFARLKPEYEAVEVYHNDDTKASYNFEASNALPVEEKGE